MPKIILIPAQFSEGVEEDGLTSSCRQFYTDSVREAGGTPLILPLGLSEHEWLQAYKLASGILLVGGSDVSPGLYGQQAHPRLGQTSELRDRMEKYITLRCFEDNKALLGICRGLQLANVALGGSLYQDLEDQFPSVVSHRQSGPDKWLTLQHKVEIKPESKLSALLCCNQIHVNSLHHQGIRDLAPGLDICAQSEDGLIEAFEAKDKRFFISVQWHPETLWQKTDRRWLNLFSGFIENCRPFLSAV